MSSASWVRTSSGSNVTERIAGLHPLALDHVDLGDAAAVRVVDDLDPADRLDLAVRLHHLLDLGQRRPGEQAGERRADRDDQQRRGRRMAALDHALGVGQELGEALGAAADRRTQRRSIVRPAPDAAAAGRAAAGGCARRRATWCGLPSRSMRPSVSSTTRSAMLSALRRWVTITIVRPREARLRLTSSTSSLAGSRPLVASSSTSRRGLRISARAMLISWRWPGREPAAALAEHGLVALRQALDELVRADELGGRDDPLERAVGGAERDVLGDRAGEQLDLLRHDPDLLAQHGRRPQADVEIVDQHAAVLGPVEAEQELRDGALARARRADQPQDLAGHDLEIDPVERERAVRAVAVAHLLEADVAAQRERRARASLASSVGSFMSSSSRAKAVRTACSCCQPPTTWRIGASARAARMVAAISAPIDMSPAIIARAPT